MLKASDLNWLVQGNQLYLSLPFSKNSLIFPIVEVQQVVVQSTYFSPESDRV
jgi:hypothetical protein